MSAGHYHKSHETAEEKELDELLKDKAVIDYMRRPFKVNVNQKVPLTGGSSLDGKVYYIDPDVGTEDQIHVLNHERLEKALRAVKGMSYNEAHRLATLYEKRGVMAKKRSWSSYKRQVAKPVRFNEKRGAEKLPKDFDLGPYRESGEMRLVK